MNDLLEAKLVIAKVKTQLLDLAGGLIADEVTDKDYAVNKILHVVAYIEEEDVKVSDIQTGSN